MSESERTGVRKIAKVTCVGGGVIGAGWAAHFMRAGLDVVVYDQAAERESYLRESLAKAMPALTELGMAPGATPSRVFFTTDFQEAVKGTDFIQESGPENIDTKISLLSEIDAHTPLDVVIASSSSGFLSSKLRSGAKHPERILVGHPFNPPFLIPLVEIAGGAAAREAAHNASAFYRSTGCEVVELDREIEGYIGNRIQYAVLREVLYLMSQGVADLESIDKAIAAGPAIRWAVMGLSSALFLGKSDPSLWGKFVESLGREMDSGYIAPSSFQPDPALMQIYAEKVANGIGANGQAGLMALRNAGVVGIRSALERVRTGLVGVNSDLD
ncbi:L-carnitine dehydrogenase [Bradyrhizobium sp. 38]|uniref:3-hydroxyacyl-CoA dehydrogenase NAD-binding domain-containing protein n=1 Tax=unclassified Bradyrhizobium TaxID=2631580 RepID=UPI001FF88BDA|nr:MULTISPECIES: 3-hydroxyacyl-CoA dehydrogenase NAD-binding domain-containing protein [unclassified Bradyrhizobium]MCK1335144.1 L-carnitine dehydrogenase [Bradyrhizobium sp. 38]MCK1776700.1 L-carnitine dehydrogenase [Bradyrhizobium sp. 132]